MPDQGTCKSCSAAVLWAKTVSGATVPLDPDPAPDGNCQILTDGRVKVLGPEHARAARADGVALHRSHFASCPFAARHRRK